MDALQRGIVVPDSGHGSTMRGQEYKPRGENCDVKFCGKLRSVRIGLAPCAQVERVERDAKQICRNKTKLRGAKTNQANDEAIDAG